MTERHPGDGTEIVDPPPSAPPRLVVVGSTTARVDRGPTKRDQIWIRMDTNLDLTVTSACRQLARHPNVFARGATLVEVLGDDLREIPIPTLRERLCETANFFTAGKKGEGLQIKQPTERIVQSIAVRGSWRDDGIREILGVTTTPMLRPDGTIADAAGYDAVTRYVHQPSFPLDPIPTAPSWEDARAALGTLAGPVALFPWRRIHDRPVALSAYLAMVLTAFVRHLVPTVPAFGVSATTPGTGKTKLAKIPSVLLHGRVQEPTKFPENEIETEKTIAGFMRKGARLILFDNIRRGIDSDTLCILTTSASYAARVLGKTEIAYYPNQALLVLTGNNLAYVGDFCRRVVPIELVATDMAPERRGFAFEPVEYALAHRAELVRAALVVLRAWWAADRPQVDPTTLGSFEAWARLVPQVLVWLGLPNPIDACASEATQDTTRGSTLALALAWEAAEALAGRKGLTVQDVVRLAYPDPPIPPKGIDALSPGAADRHRAALERHRAATALADRIEAAVDESGRAGVAKKLPYALRAVRGRILDAAGRRFEGRPDRTRMMHWSVLADAPAPE